MSLKTFGLITVRSNSKRLKNKCLLKFGKINVLEHIILRCKFCGITPVICTSRKKSDDKIINIAKKMNAKFFRGPEKNKLLRWYQCCLKHKIKIFHTIDADDPFFDWEAIFSSISILKKYKLDVVLPSKVSREGGASEGYSFKLYSLKKIINSYKYLKNPNYDSEMIDFFLKILKSKVYKGKNYQLKNVRLTLDYKEDYYFLKKIILSNSFYSHRKNINKFIFKNKKYIKINYFRNTDWKKKQMETLSKYNLNNYKF